MGNKKQQIIMKITIISLLFFLLISTYLAQTVVNSGNENKNLFDLDSDTIEKIFENHLELSNWEKIKAGFIRWFEIIATELRIQIWKEAVTFKNDFNKALIEEQPELENRNDIEKEIAERNKIIPKINKRLFRLHERIDNQEKNLMIRVERQEKENKFLELKTIIKNDYTNNLVQRISDIKEKHKKMMEKRHPKKTEEEVKKEEEEAKKRTEEEAKKKAEEEKMEKLNQILDEVKKIEEENNFDKDSDYAPEIERRARAEYQEEFNTVFGNFASKNSSRLLVL